MANNPENLKGIFAGRTTFVLSRTLDCYTLDTECNRSDVQITEFQ